MQYVKLNTNESPFPPSQNAILQAAKAAQKLQLYCDPECNELHKAFEKTLGYSKNEVIFTNGSDEILNFAFMAFCDEEHPAVFPDISYGFYPVFAQINRIPYETIPLKEDFSIDVNDYIGIEKNIFIANPNAPTGIALSVEEIERIVASNPNNLVLIDEAYVDFGGKSCAPLTRKYDNLLVAQTFSKSRSMAGARLGFGIACPALIQDLNTIKYSTNPYNVNTMTQVAGIGMLLEQAEVLKNCETIIENRSYTATELKKRGFLMTDSKTNFLFTAHPAIGGKQLYEALREKGILVRHFEKERLSPYNRITIGSREQMDALLQAIDRILADANLT